MYKFLLLTNKYNKLIILIVIIVFFFIGFFSLKNINFHFKNLSLNTLSFKSLLINNSGYYLVLLFGFLSFNISLYPLVAYNSFFWGTVFKTTMYKSNLVNAISLFSPHVFFEIFWIIIVTNISTKISIILFEEFNDIKNNDFQCSKLIKEIFFGYFVVILGVLIEFFITNKL